MKNCSTISLSHHRSSALTVFPFLSHTPLSLKSLPHPNRAETCEVERNGNNGTVHHRRLSSLFFPSLSSPPALLRIHSWTILWGSYVNAWVCFWLEGTKSTLYKCTLKQLPPLPTGATTQTSDWAAVWPAYSGGRVGCGSFTTMSLSSWHASDFETVNKIRTWRQEKRWSDKSQDFHSGEFESLAKSHFSVSSNPLLPLPFGP